MISKSECAVFVKKLLNHNKFKDESTVIKEIVRPQQNRNAVGGPKRMMPPPITQVFETQEFGPRKTVT
jgi:hypothetical protein